jgi:hypothetical protein
MDRNLTAVTTTKIIMKVRLKNKINFANFLTLLDYHGVNERARVFPAFLLLRKNKKKDIIKHE